MSCPMAIRCLDGVPYCRTCKAAPRECTECASDIIIEGETTCPECRPHNYVISVAVTLQYGFRLADIERAIEAMLDEKRIRCAGSEARVIVRSIEATEDTL